MNSSELQELAILIVDDQEDVRRGLQRLIGTLGCDVDICASAEEALDQLSREKYDIVFTDVKMDGMSGEELLHEIHRRWTDIEVVMITGHGTIEMAVACLQNGASHFITKPFDNREILAFVEHAGLKLLSRRQAAANLEKYRSRSIIAVDARMRQVLELVDRVAASKVPVLLQGESGTGKELIAHEIHNRSPLADRPFLAINCVALPDSLLESELFGYRRGAFTGAHKDTQGLFEQVQGGTIFLDEVASMSMSFQGKLLRVLQEKRVRPLGGGRDVAVDFRLIAASNRDLEGMVREGVFREDLFYRLQVMKIELPRLAERPACIPALAEYFLKRAAAEFFFESNVCPELTPDAIDVLRRHEWHGNVRELENTIQRALVVCQGDKILPSHLGLASEAALPGEALEDPGSYETAKQKALDAFQQEFVQKALQRTAGNISRAAELCGLTRAALQRIMRKHGIERERF